MKSINFTLSYVLGEDVCRKIVSRPLNKLKGHADEKLDCVMPDML